MAEGYRFSFDMLGEAAYTKADAVRYYASYQQALATIAAELPDNSHRSSSGPASR
jgi:proline dehydrogenase